LGTWRTPWRNTLGTWRTSWKSHWELWEHFLRTQWEHDGNKRTLKHTGVSQENGFGSACLHNLQWLVKRAEHTTLHHLGKDCTNYMWLQLSVSDWLIVMIGPGGLLLVFSHLFVELVSVWWVGLLKSI
jgi:hypothetical protein